MLSIFISLCFCSTRSRAGKRAASFLLDGSKDIIRNASRCNTAAFNPIPGFETYSADKKQLFKIGLLSLLNRPFYILHSGKFRCRLYGNDFSLREVSVLMGPYTAKGSGAICKAITYAADDKRKINLRLQEHSVCYLITDKSKVDIAGLVKGLGEYIKVNHMDCVWDFIYEVQT